MPDDPGELIALRRKLTFMATRRSMREMEALLAGFVERVLPTLDADGCHRMLELLHRQADADLLDWISGGVEPPPGVDRDLIDLLAAHRR